MSSLRTWGFTPRWYRIASPTLLKTRAFLAFSLVSAAALTGCTSAPAPKPAKPTKPAIQYPARPSIAPPAFKVLRQDAQGITLVAPVHATDEQIEAILWQLRDAARDHTFDSLHISQKLVDARDPIEWFHIYRGPKCAAEKYTNGPLPCGAAYHAAGDFTLGSFHNKDLADGALLQDENHQTELWPTSATPKP